MTDADAQTIAAGAKAQDALDYLAPYFAELRNKALDLWSRSNLEHTDLREKLFLSVRTINHVEGAIRSMIDQARAAEVMAEHPSLKVLAENALAEHGLTRP